MAATSSGIVRIDDGVRRLTIDARRHVVVLLPDGLGGVKAVAETLCQRSHDARESTGRRSRAGERRIHCR